MALWNVEVEYIIILKSNKLPCQLNDNRHACYRFSQTDASFPLNYPPSLHQSIKVSMVSLTSKYIIMDLHNHVIKASANEVPTYKSLNPIMSTPLKSPTRRTAAPISTIIIEHTFDSHNIDVNFQITLDIKHLKNQSKPCLSITIQNKHFGLMVKLLRVRNRDCAFCNMPKFRT